MTLSDRLPTLLYKGGSKTKHEFLFYDFYDAVSLVAWIERSEIRDSFNDLPPLEQR